MDKNVDKFKVLVQGENYRVATISRIAGLEQVEQGVDIKVENLDISEGLNIEERTEDNNYIVINTIRWNEKEKDVYIENVGSRILTTLSYKEFNVNDYFKRIQEYLNCLEFARKVLIDIHNETMEEEGYFIEPHIPGDNRVFCYKGFEVEIFDDEDGQQFWFEFNGKEYGCGSFNPFPEEEIKYVIDEYLKEIPNA